MPAEPTSLTPLPLPLQQEALDSTISRLQEGDPQLLPTQPLSPGAAQAAGDELLRAHAQELWRATGTLSYSSDELAWCRLRMPGHFSTCFACRPAGASTYSGIPLHTCCTAACR